MTTKETPEPQNVDDWIKAEAAKDYEGLLVQFRAMKCLLNSQGERLSWYANRDYSLGEARLKDLIASLESEREMNAELTAEVEKLSHPKPEPSGDMKAALDGLHGIVKLLRFSSNPIQTDERYGLANDIYDYITALTAQQQDVNQELLEASKELVARWHTPIWKDVPATAVYINKLEQAITRAEQKGQSHEQDQ